MKLPFLSSGTFALLVWGCASSPTTPTAMKTGDRIPEKTITSVSGNQNDLLILRQPGGKTTPSGSELSKSELGKKSSLESASAACPPGQLMATRIITGETGTRITEECLTPFSSKGRRNSQNRPVAIKVRNTGSGFSTETVTRK